MQHDVDVALVRHVHVHLRPLFVLGVVYDHLDVVVGNVQVTP